jgi:CRISPR-associated protein Csh2
MCNPNGDPDENRPRIDKDTGRNLVTEFRLKRTIRDFIYQIMAQKNNVERKKIFMRKELKTETGRVLKYIEDLASDYIKYYKIEDKNNKIRISKEEFSKLKRDKKANIFPEIDENRLKDDHIDIRLFGILFAVPDIHFKQIGPVQFSIGQSLNKVEDDIEIRMARIVPNTRKEAEQNIKQNEEEQEELPRGAESGTFGEKYVVRYSFIEFHGFVNNNVANEASLTEQDVNDMMIAMWRGTDSLSTSSKFGQKSRLLIKVNYKDNGYIGDLDQKCELENQKATLENISQMSLNIYWLCNLLERNSEIIESIEYDYNSELRCRYDGDIRNNFEEALNDWKDKSKVKIPISRLSL